VKPLREHVKPAIRAVARRGGYFLKVEVVHEVLRRAELTDAVVQIRRTYVGRGLDDAIIGYLEVEVARQLRARDDHGLRMFECYADANGQRRWRRLIEMRAADIRRVTRDLRTLRDQLADKVAAYDLLLEELERAGEGARVADVYDRAWQRIVTARIRVDRLAS